MRLKIFREISPVIHAAEIPLYVTVPTQGLLLSIVSAMNLVAASCSWNTSKCDNVIA